MSDLTPEQMAYRGQRAKAALDEFLVPEFAYIREHYTKRLIDLATTELDPKKRAEKITTISTALRVIDELEQGINIAVASGQTARQSLLKIETIGQMSPLKQRLARFSPL